MDIRDFPWVWLVLTFAMLWWYAAAFRTARRAWAGLNPAERNRNRAVLILFGLVVLGVCYKLLWEMNQPFETGPLAPP